MRLIDADNLISVLDILSDKGGDIRYWEQLKLIVADCPTADVVEVVKEWCDKRNCIIVAREDFPRIEVRHGRWINCGWSIKCSICDYDMPFSVRNYCPNCGAKMEGHFEEPEINPCRGCEDYDGKGGCISNGGCGASMDEVSE